MWWKALSVLLVLYTLAVGMLVPLKPGIAYVSPDSAKSGDSIRVTFYGYNTFYTRSRAGEDIRVWLQYDSAQAVLGQSLKVLNDTMLEASFVLPANLPRPTQSVMLNAILDHPVDGVSLLPDAVEITRDTASNSSATWTQNPVGQLHIVKDFSFPYRNVIYESIRNTYYHVPMWFALMFLFAASGVYSSVLFLLGKKLDYDRWASALAEAGLLFG
jgi:heme exporter protein C